MVVVVVVVVMMMGSNGSMGSTGSTGARGSGPEAGNAGRAAGSSGRGGGGGTTGGGSATVMHPTGACLLNRCLTRNESMRYLHLGWIHAMTYFLWYSGKLVATRFGFLVVIRLAMVNLDLNFEWKTHL